MRKSPVDLMSFWSRTTGLLLRCHNLLFISPFNTAALNTKKFVYHKYHKVSLTRISTYHLFLPYHRTMQRGLNHISSLMLQASDQIEVTLLI
jgi:hypothetical protein